MSKRLALLFVVLALALALAVYVQLRLPTSFAARHAAPAGPSAPDLSNADRARLAALQAEFVKERDTYLKLKNAGAPEAQVDAQWQKVTKAVEAVQALGGTAAIGTLPTSKYAPVTRGGGKRGVTRGPG